MKLTPSPVKLAATERGIAVFQPTSLKTVDAQAALASLEPDLMIVAAYGLILPQAVLDIPRLGCLNIHASLLPRWRGAAPIQRALLAGDRETGVGIMRMEAGLDTGAVLLEKRTPIAVTDTSAAVHDRLARLGADAIVEIAWRLARGEQVAEIPQATDGVTYAHKFSSDDARIDWSQPVEVIDRVVRAFNPVPGAWTTWRGEKIKIWGAQIEALPTAIASAKHGEVFRDNRDLRIACGSAERGTMSALTLLEVQIPGGKRIPASAWLSAKDAPQTSDLLV